MSTIKTFAAIILDKSGSMAGMKDFAINTFNEQIQTLKEESDNPKEVTKKILKGKKGVTGIETRLTLVSFNDNVQFHTFNEDVKDIEEFPAKEYNPSGSTALFDAIGETIDRFTDEIPELEEEDAGALLVIITDGQENASKKFFGEKGRKTLKSRIEELQETGKWTITFMGAEDVLETAVQGLGLSAMNTSTWNTSDPLAATRSSSIGTRSYMDSRMSGMTSVENFYSSSNIGIKEDATSSGSVTIKSKVVAAKSSKSKKKKKK